MIDADYTSFLQTNNLVGDPGLAVGQQAAKALHTQHRPIVAMPAFNGGTEPGKWRPTASYQGNPPNPLPFSPMAFLYAAFTTPFTLNRPSQFRPQPPPPLTSEHYRRDYDEVKAFGPASAARGQRSCPNTVGDPTWEPLVNTPPYPDYTSGANNVTGAMMTILQNFFGTDDFEYTVASNNALV